MKITYMKKYWYYPKVDLHLMIDMFVLITKMELATIHYLVNNLGRCHLYDKPYEYNRGTLTFPTARCNKHQWIYKLHYAHEVGVDNVDATGAKLPFQLYWNLVDFSLNV